MQILLDLCICGYAGARLNRLSEGEKRKCSRFWIVVARPAIMDAEDTITSVVV